MAKPESAFFGVSLTILTLAVSVAGPALAQPLPVPGSSVGGPMIRLTPGRAAGLFRARQLGGGVILVGVGAAAAGGVALAMAAPGGKTPAGQGAVINSTSGTTP